jgi:hypothetical protein
MTGSSAIEWIIFKIYVCQLHRGRQRHLADFDSACSLTDPGSLLGDFERVVCIGVHSAEELGGSTNPSVLRVCLVAVCSEGTLLKGCSWGAV